MRYLTSWAFQRVLSLAIAMGFGWLCLMSLTFGDALGATWQGLGSVSALCYSARLHQSRFRPMRQVLVILTLVMAVLSVLWVVRGSTAG